MTIPIEFVVTGKPSSVNSTTLKKNVWVGIVNAAAQVQVNLQYPGVAPSMNDATVKLCFFPHNNQYLDVDNGIKHTIDAFCPPILANDKSVQRVMAERFMPAPGAALCAAAAASVTIANALAIQAAGNHATAIKVEGFANSGAIW